jgi:hypothetical protein
MVRKRFKERHDMSSHSASSDKSTPARLLPIAVSLSIVVVVAGVVLAVVLLTRGSHARPTLSSSPSGRPSVLASKFHGLALAGHDRDVLVGLGLHAGGPIDVVVIPSDERTIDPHDVRVSVAGRMLSGSGASPCGERCLRFRASVLAGAPRALIVDVGQAARVQFDLPARMPPRADALLRRARERMLRVRSLTMNETLGSGLGKTVVSRWSFQAPDRMQYKIAGGSRAVVIGTRRWDSAARGWTPSSTTRLRIPAYPWERTQDPRLLGRATLAGTPVRLVAARTPGAFPTWFVLSVAADARVLRSQMLTTAHFMTDSYGAFDAAPQIRPPQ